MDKVGEELDTQPAFESENSKPLAETVRDQHAKTAALYFGGMILNACVVSLNWWIPTTVISIFTAAACGYGFVLSSLKYFGSKTK